ncbi:MAG TPA: PAS domain-containing protein [Blastocatellia bacterium]|nr:PAS domain-containing protein [Blastocatellia bacterium]
MNRKSHSDARPDAAAHRDEAGRVTAYVSANSDINERKRLEEAIRQNEESLARAQQIARLGSWDWDLRTDQVAWSDEVYRIFGISRDEFGGKYEDVLTYIHSEDVEGVKQKAEGEWRRPGSADLDFRIVRPDGAVRVLNGQSQIYLDDEGKAIRMAGTIQDITERKRMEERLKRSNEELRALSARLQAVREEESLRIARAIHDELGGALTALKIDLAWLGKRLAKSHNEALRQKLKSMAELIDETAQKVRMISTELRPSVLDDLGLAAAIEWQAREFQRRTETECRIVSLAEVTELSAEKATAVFRIFQEVLTNVARHAEASLVEISLEEHDEAIVLRVADDGRGIGPLDAAGCTSLGLLGMRERALVFGGSVDIQGAEGRGTTVTVSIPRA